MLNPPLGCMTPIEWLIMGTLVAIFGVIPPFIVGHYMLRKSQLLLDEAIKIRVELPGIIKSYLASEDFTKVVNNVVTGKLNYSVKEVKDNMMKEGSLNGLPPPAKAGLVKGASLFLSKYGIPRSFTEGALSMMINKKTPAQQAHDEALIKSYAADAGYMQPQIPEMPQTNI